MIKKFSSPKFKIWFPPEADRRADGFDFAQDKLFFYGFFLW